MKKVYIKIFLVLLIIFSTCNLPAVASTKLIIPKNQQYPITIWNNEYTLYREIYLFENGQFTLVDEKKFRPSDFKKQNLIYYPKIEIRLYTQILETKAFVGYAEIITEPNTKVEYQMELRTDSTRTSIDLGDTPDLILLQGSFESTGEKVHISFDTTAKEHAYEWINKVNKSFRLDFQLRIFSPSGVRTFNLGKPLNLTKD